MPSGVAGRKPLLVNADWPAGFQLLGEGVEVSLLPLIWAGEAVCCANRPDAFTLIDLRPLRRLVFASATRHFDADLVRTIHGFDALLVFTGSTASANL